MSKRFARAAALALAALLVLGALPMPALAARAAGVTVRLSVQGVPLTTTGELVDGTTFVPVKALSAELGFTVAAPDPGQVADGRADIRPRWWRTTPSSATRVDFSTFSSRTTCTRAARTDLLSAPATSLT